MIYDIAIVGSGPAGITSAIYARRANKSVIVIEKESMGGLITHSPKIENYPGFNVISGIELADKFISQAMELQTEFEFDEVVSINKSNDVFNVNLPNKVIEARSVIIATGSTHRKLNLENEDVLTGKGISYCAVCDGPFYSNKDVVVVGGGNSALQEALLLASYTKSVTMVQNLSFLTGENALIEQVKNNEKIKVIYDSIATKLNGTDILQSIEFTNTKTNEKFEMSPDCVFVAIGQVANNKPFENVCDLDERGFIISNDRCLTKTEGIFVAGDCRVKQIRQIVTASGDGSIACIEAIKYLDKRN